MELQTLWEEVEEELSQNPKPSDEPIITRYRSADQNLRTTFLKIIRRAGLEPREKLFQNLPSIRETELCEDYPLHVACAWVGNTAAVVTKHYLQVGDEHVQKASEATQNPTQNTSEKVGKAGNRHTTHARIIAQVSVVPPVTHN